MRTLWLLIGMALLAGALAFGAIACDGGGEEEEPTPGVTAPLPTLEPTPTPEEATPTEGATPGVSGEALELTLAEVAGSGVTGSATLTPTDGTTEVAVTIDGGLAEGEYLLHIHQGTCAAQGAFVEALLPNLIAQPDGSAEGTAETTQTLDTLTATDHYLVVFDQNTPLACADIAAS